MPIDYKKLYLKCFEEKKALKKEQFDNMEELAKQEGMCLVDIQIFDRLINYEKENEELKEVNEQLEAEAERTGELESIVWIDFYGEKEVIDDIKAYRFRDDIIAMKKENEEIKKLKEKHESRNKEFYDLLARNRGMRSQNEWKTKEVEKRFDENKELKKQIESRKSLCDHFEYLSGQNFAEKEEHKKEIEFLTKKLLILEEYAGPTDTRILYEDKDFN